MGQQQHLELGAFAVSNGVPNFTRHLFIVEFDYLIVESMQLLREDPVQDFAGPVWDLTGLNPTDKPLGLKTGERHT